MVVVGSGCESVQGFTGKAGEATGGGGGGGVVAGTTDGLRAGSERREWWLVRPIETGRTWAGVVSQRGGCGAGGGAGGKCHRKQIPGWPGYSGCRRCSATDHRSSGCTGTSRSQGQVQQRQQQSMQVHAQVQTLQSLVDDEVRQHGEHWARMRIEMALESAKKKSCGTVVGAEQQQQRQVPAAKSQWELQREQRDAAQRRARRAKQAAEKAKEKAARFGFIATKYPLPRARLEAAQAQVQVKTAEAARRAAVCSELKAEQVVEEGVPPRWVDETSREHGERRAQHDRAGRAEADRSDATVLRRRAEAALVVAKAAKAAADAKVAAERKKTVRAAGKAAEEEKAVAAASVAASQAHEKLRQVVAGLQQSQAAASVVQGIEEPQQASELWNASVQVAAQLRQEQEASDLWVASTNFVVPGSTHPH